MPGGGAGDGAGEGGQGGGGASTHRSAEKGEAVVVRSSPVRSAQIVGLASEAQQARHQLEDSERRRKCGEAALAELVDQVALLSLLAL